MYELIPYWLWTLMLLMLGLVLCLASSRDDVDSRDMSARRGQHDRIAHDGHRRVDG